MTRVYNFSPGPAILPEPVLKEAQQNLFALPDLGVSILEVSHRAPAFLDILEAAKRNIRKLLELPDSYQVLFLQGGARLQFSMIPMNFIRDGRADYIVTGSWSEKAVAEARKEGAVDVAWDGKATNFDRLPTDDDLNLNADAAYAYYTSNETIQGVQFQSEPDTSETPLVCDASSDFLSRPIDIKRHGLIYDHAQKNAGPAGVTIVVISDDFVERCPGEIAGMLNYRNHVEGDSCYNTPPVFGVYIVKLVSDWLLDEIGGLAAMQRQNEAKAAALYKVIDESEGFYAGHAEPDCRSRMNVTFRLPSDELQSEFIAQAAQRELRELKGHRSVGGIRASIYNAMPTEGVTRLAEFMIDFWKKHK